MCLTEQLMLWAGYGNQKEAEGSVKGNTRQHRSQERNEIALDDKLCLARTALPGSLQTTQPWGNNADFAVKR